MRILFLIALVGLLLTPRFALAQSVLAQQSYGEFTLAAATEFCMSSGSTPAMLPGTNGYLVINKDTADIFIGFDSNVSNTHYVYELRPWSTGDFFSKIVTFQNNALGTSLCFYSVAGTAANAVHVGGSS